MLCEAHAQEAEALLSTAPAYQKGIQYYDQEDWPEAARWLRQAVAEDPQNEAAWYDLALVYFKMNDYLETELTLEKLFSLNPLHAGAQGLYGLTLYHRGAFARAIKAFNYAIENEPKKELRLARAYSYIAAGSPKYALPDFDEILYDDPGNFKACLGKGAALMELGQHKYAIRFFNRMLDFDPGHTEALTNRAVSYFYLGEQEKSAADFELALSLKPTAAVFIAEAKCNLKAKNFPAASADIKSAIRSSPENAEVYFVLGEIEMAKGAYRKAKQSFDIALDLDHTFVDCYLSRSEAVAMVADYEMAIEDLYQVLDREPGNKKAKDMLLWVYAKMDKEILLSK